MILNLAVTPGEVTTSLTILVMVFVFVRALRSKGRKQLSPPGPWSFPIIGNLLQLGEHPYLTLMEMRKKYGDVFLLKLGMVPVLVVNGMEMVKQVLLKDGEHFAGRPNMHTFSFLAEGKSLSFSVNYGESWKLHKKIASKALRTLSNAEAKSSTCSCLLEEHVTEEVSELVTVFVELSSKNGGFDPRNAITCAVANVVCALCFGKRYDHSDEEFLKIVKTNDDLLKASSAANPADFIPCLRYLPLQIINAPREFYRALNGFIALHVQDHLATYDKDHIRDITDALINVCHNKYAAAKTDTLNDSEIISTVNDLFGAGFETVSTCLYWSFLYLIHYPEIQAKIQEEIDGNIGLKPPRFEDRKILPYTEAFISEVFRHASFLPFTIPHCTTADTTLNGYFIPRKTCTFINMYQVNHDETIWDNPSLFRPDRFLNENRELNKSLVEKVLIFGMGIRKCLGEDVARNEIFIFITAVLQQLKLKKCPRAKLDLTPTYGLAMRPKPYQLEAERRSSGSSSASILRLRGGFLTQFRKIDDLNLLN
ncbi:cytochrome P450 family 1 subfamily D member 1 [Macaca mulatta]|uniref:Cytochrome P450 1A n=1 Tax=Macaca mulatta TaxID=9544 RepID=G4V3Q9_MACMU|nr:cytochrome P450 family 1 subfamily D member 1 [Macaca mulatta]ADM53745.1 cytochrome P450 1D1 [Macaca mulatta]